MTISTKFRETVAEVRLLSPACGCCRVSWVVEVNRQNWVGRGKEQEQGCHGSSSHGAPQIVSTPFGWSLPPFFSLDMHKPEHQWEVRKGKDGALRNQRKLPSMSLSPSQAPCGTDHSAMFFAFSLISVISDLHGHSRGTHLQRKPQSAP